MIVARMHGEDGQVVIMLVLEPGNIQKLKAGEPIHRFLNEFIPELPSKVELLFAYTPDIQWVSEQMSKSGKDALNFAEILQDSLHRPEVVRSSRAAEALKPADVIPERKAN
jgi:hypothetical protein